jgi:hypothetical protein
VLRVPAALLSSQSPSPKLYPSPSCRSTPGNVLPAR